MASTLVLVDYDNQRPQRFGIYAGAGRPPNHRDHEEGFRALREAIAGHLRTTTTETIEARFRFYGGWSHAIDGTRTDAGELMSNIIYEHGRTRIKNVRVVAELAESLAAFPKLPLHRTFRQVAWAGDRLVLQSKPVHCADAAPSCPYYETLRSWGRGRCPNRSACRVEARDCVEQKVQKIVDSMIVADAIIAAAEGFDVVVVSMDDDFVPGLLGATWFKRRASLLRFGRKNLPGDYDDILMQRGIEIYDYPNLS